MEKVEQLAPWQTFSQGSRGNNFYGTLGYYLGISGRGVGPQWPAAGLGTLSVAVCAWDLLKEVSIIFITSTIVWPQVKYQGGNTAWPINRKLD